MEQNLGAMKDSHPYTTRLLKEALAKENKHLVNWEKLFCEESSTYDTKKWATVNIPPCLIRIKDLEEALKILNNEHFK
jgi:hypothetical protein